MPSVKGLPTIHHECFFWPFRSFLWTAIRPTRLGRAISHRSSIGLCLLTIAKRGAIDVCQMTRPVHVALVLIAVFSVTYVLIAPDPTDDATAVLRATHLGKAQILAVYVVLPLAPQIAIFRLSTPSSSNQKRSTTLELVDLFCTYRC